MAQGMVGCVLVLVLALVLVLVRSCPGAAVLEAGGVDAPQSAQSSVGPCAWRGGGKHDAGSAAGLSSAAVAEAAHHYRTCQCHPNASSSYPALNNLPCDALTVA